MCHFLVDLWPRRLIYDPSDWQGIRVSKTGSLIYRVKLGEICFLVDVWIHTPRHMPMKFLWYGPPWSAFSHLRHYLHQGLNKVRGCSVRHRILSASFPATMATPGTPKTPRKVMCISPTRGPVEMREELTFAPRKKQNVSLTKFLHEDIANVKRDFPMSGKRVLRCVWQGAPYCETLHGGCCRRIYMAYSMSDFSRQRLVSVFQLRLERFVVMIRYTSPSPVEGCSYAWQYIYKHRQDV